MQKQDAVALVVTYIHIVELWHPSDQAPVVFVRAFVVLLEIVALGVKCCLRYCSFDTVVVVSVVLRLRENKEVAMERG